MADDVVLNKIVQAIVEEHLSDFTQFTERMLATDGFRSEE